jgi:hypothetical protein
MNKKPNINKLGDEFSAIKRANEEQAEEISCSVQ